MAIRCNKRHISRRGNERRGIAAFDCALPFARGERIKRRWRQRRPILPAEARGIRVHRRVNGFCDSTSLLSRHSRWNVILWSLYIEREERSQARIRDRGSALACFLMHKTNFEERALLTFLSPADIRCRKRAARLPAFWKEKSIERERERERESTISERLNLTTLQMIKTITRLNYARLDWTEEWNSIRAVPNRSDK